MANKELYIGTSTPKSNEVVWIRPLKSGGVALYAYVYNKWQVLKLVNGKGTLPVDDDEVIDPATPGGNYYTKGEIDEKIADILGIDADQIDELIEIVTDDDTITGLLTEVKNKYTKVSGIEITTEPDVELGGTNPSFQINSTNYDESTKMDGTKVAFISGTGQNKVSGHLSINSKNGKLLAVSQGKSLLTDDCSIITASDVPSIKTSQLNNDAGFIDKKDIAPVEEVTKSRNNYDSSAGVISFITGDGEVYYPSVKGGTVSFYESTVDMIFSNDFISLAQYTISFVKDTASSVQIKDGDNVLYTVEPYTPAAGPIFRIKSLVKDSNGTYTAVVSNNPPNQDYGYTTITFTSDTLTIAPVGNPSYMTTNLQDISGAAITYLKHTELSTLHKVAITGSYNDLADTPSIPDITGKADKVSNATNGNFAALDSNGNLTDSGHKHSDYQASLVSGTNIKTINSTSIVGSGNLSVGTVTGVKINNTTKTPTSGTVDLGTVLTSTTDSVINGSSTPITSGGVYTTLQSYLTTIIAKGTYEKKIIFAALANLPDTCSAYGYYRITENKTSLTITLPSNNSSTVGDTICVSFTAGSSITTPTVNTTASGDTVYKQDGWSNFFEANATYEIVALYDGGKWLVTATKFNS